MRGRVLNLQVKQIIVRTKMKKTEYIKPEIQVVNFALMSSLLVVSGDGNADLGPAEDD